MRLKQKTVSYYKRLSEGSDVAVEEEEILFEGDASIPHRYSREFRYV